MSIRRAPFTGSYTCRKSALLLVASTFLMNNSALAADGTVAVALGATKTDGEAGDDQPIVVVGQRPGYQAEVSATATKTDTPLLDVPQSVSVITGQQIADQAMRSISDVLRYVPGALAAQGEGHRDQIVLRGNSSTADFFVDGLRDDVQYYRGLYNLDRVEVLKGPNAMIFGRGGGGGVINRVTKRPVEGNFAKGAISADNEGAWFAEGDANAMLGGGVTGRLNAVYEKFDTFRDEFGGHRIGINPTLAVKVGSGTRIDASFEYARDRRVVDRGVPSGAGRPVEGFDDTFFGAEGVNRSRFAAKVGKLQLEHHFGDALRLTSKLLYGDYDKLYGNLFPASAVTGGVPGFNVEAYEDGTERTNLISQTDLVFTTRTGAIGHTLLVGFEYSDQDTQSFRSNGLFANPDPLLANVSPRRVNLTDPFAPPPIVAWSLARSNETDVKVAALYAQDQIALGRHVELVAGLRFDRFRIEARNRVNGLMFDRTDKLVSPRLGLVVKPNEKLSLYASFARSFLPQSGDQFTSLDLTAAALKPERFTNLELGAKWQALPGLDVALAGYRLDRTNTREIDPVTLQAVLTGEQRSKGLELEVRGRVTPRLSISGGASIQDVRIRKSATALLVGRKAPLAPEFQASLWGRYDFSPRIGAGLGLYHQSKTYASISNAVVLPAHSRVDAAGFFGLTEAIAVQVNVENILGADYFATAHNDNNITPGAPRTVRATLRFGL